MCQIALERLFDRMWPIHKRKVPSLSAQVFSGYTLHKMVRSNHNRSTFTCSDRSRSLRYRNTRKSLDVMPRLYPVWRIWLSKPIVESRRADSNRLITRFLFLYRLILPCERRLPSSHLPGGYRGFFGHYGATVRQPSTCEGPVETSILAVSNKQKFRRNPRSSIRWTSWPAS